MLSALETIIESIRTFFREFSGSGSPPVPWDQYYNKLIDTILRLPERHGYSVRRTEPQEQGGQDDLHFDQTDYEILSSFWSGHAARLRGMTPLPRTAEGTIDYDRACAAEIVTLAASITRTMTHVSEDFNLDAVNRTRLREVTEFAEMLSNQWGTRLYEH